MIAVLKVLRIRPIYVSKMLGDVFPLSFRNGLNNVVVWGCLFFRL